MQIINFNAYIDATPDNTLNLAVDVRGYTHPLLSARPCPDCLNREAKRVEDNEKTRISRQQVGVSVADDELATSAPAQNSKGKSKASSGAAPIPTSMVVFNCPEILDFSHGRVVLPLRIICYCSHHSEKEGFRCAFLC